MAKNGKVTTKADFVICKKIILTIEMPVVTPSIEMPVVTPLCEFGMTPPSCIACDPQ